MSNELKLVLVRTIEIIKNEGKTEFAKLKANKRVEILNLFSAFEADFAEDEPETWFSKSYYFQNDLTISFVSSGGNGDKDFEGKLKHMFIDADNGTFAMFATIDTINDVIESLQA